MKMYNHDAETVVEACFGVKDLVPDHLDIADMLRFLIMVAVVDFFERMNSMNEKDRVIVDILFAVAGVDRVSKAVELVEKVFFEIASNDPQVAEDLLKVFATWADLKAQTNRKLM